MGRAAEVIASITGCSRRSAEEAEERLIMNKLLVADLAEEGEEKAQVEERDISEVLAKDKRKETDKDKKT